MSLRRRVEAYGEKLESKIGALINLNLCVMYPKELFRYTELNPDGYNRLHKEFRNRHNVLITSTAHTIAGEVTIFCSIDGINSFKILSRTESCRPVLYVVSLDGKPVVDNFQSMREAVKGSVENPEHPEWTSEETLKNNLEELSEMFPWGTQKMQLVEEIGELLQALSKYERANGMGQPTSVTQNEAWNNLIEEFAGVQVMVCELMKILDIEEEVKSEMLSQTNRTLERVKQSGKESQ